MKRRTGRKLKTVTADRGPAGVPPKIIRPRATRRQEHSPVIEEWTLSPAELQGVLRAAPDKRYRYFVNKVADKGAAYTLRDDEGYILYGDQQRQELVPLWPHTAFAARCMSTSKCWVEAVALPELLELWLPGMARDKRWAAVFPKDEEGAAVGRDPNELAGDLIAELESFL